ncbi:protein fem-1 B, partial [Clarias magur]
MLQCYPNPETVIAKELPPPVKAYGGRIECRTFQELEAIKQNYDALHMEGLVV